MKKKNSMFLGRYKRKILESLWIALFPAIFVSQGLALKRINKIKAGTSSNQPYSERMEALDQMLPGIRNCAIITFVIVFSVIFILCMFYFVKKQKSYRDKHG